MDCAADSTVNEGGITLDCKEEFCENIRLYEKSMYHLAFSLLKNEADAGDVVSESIYRAYKNLHTLKHKKAFKSWILQIVHNTAVEVIRKNSKLVLMEEMEHTAGQSCECDITTKVTVREAVENLKQPYQTVVRLFYYENLSLLEISRITDTSIVTAKKQLSRARKMLLEVLKEDFEK